MRYQETILSSSGASSSSHGLGAVTIHDLQTGSLLASFKQTCAEIHSTAVLQTKNGQGGFVLAAQPDKSLLNAYNFQKSAKAGLARSILINLTLILLRIKLQQRWSSPEKLSCIAIDKSGDYCAGGTAQGRIYLWEASSHSVRILNGCPELS